MRGGLNGAGIASRAAWMATLLFAFGATLPAQNADMTQYEQLPVVSTADAQEALHTAGQWLHLRRYGGFLFWDSEDVDLKTLQVGAKEIRFDAHQKNTVRHLRIPYQSGDEFVAGCNEFFCTLAMKAHSAGQLNGVVQILDENQKSNYGLAFGTNGSGGGLQKSLCARAPQGEVDNCKRSAALFAAALNALIRSPLAHGFDEAVFQQNAARWRALGTKPPMSEALRVRRALAEDAI